MSSLFVLLTAEQTAPPGEFEYLLSPDGRTVQQHASAPAALLPLPAGAGAEVVAVLPASALSWHRVELPRGVSGAARMRSVLEGLLEDQLLDEPQALHFALEPQARAGAPAWVAVCRRAPLVAQLQALESAGRPVSRVVPEIAPELPGSLHVVGEPAQPRLLASNAAGVLAVPLTLQSLALLPPMPEDVPCFAEPAVAEIAEQTLQRAVVLQTPAQRCLQAAQSSWDLAQFELASSGRARQLKKLATGWGSLLRAPQWRPVRWALGVLVLSQLVGINALAWKERNALDAKQAAVRDTLTRSFPQVRVVVDAPVQMEREVAALRQATGTLSGRDMESLLAALAQVAGERRPSGLEFNGSELRVRGLALPPADLARVQSELRAQGVAASAQGEVLVLSAGGTP